MRACLALLVICCVSCAPTGPREDPRWLDHGKACADAETAFEKGIQNKGRLLVARKHFSDSTDAYLKLHRAGLVQTPQLYRNLGNAAALADRWPIAIWAYHVGLKLDPNDADMRAHLTIVRSKVMYSSKNQGRPDADSWPAWLHRPTRDELTWIVLLAYVLAWIVGTYAFLTRDPRLIFPTVFLIIVIASAGAGRWRASEQAEFDRQSPLVVVTDNTDFYRGNADSYPKHADLPFLPRGLEARQLHRRGNWLQIRLSTGEVGWVPAGKVLVVEP